MKTKIAIALTVLLCAAGFLYQVRSQTPAKQTTGQQWEYMTYTARVYDEALNDLGKQGWDLVAVTPYSSAGGSGQMLYFKRPRP